MPRLAGETDAEQVDVQAGRVQGEDRQHVCPLPLWAVEGARASVARDACSGVGLQLSRDPGCWDPCAAPFVTVKALLEHNSSHWSEPPMETRSDSTRHSKVS